MVAEKPDDGLQHPLVHEGGDTDEVATNERGDDKATVQQPSGAEVPNAEQRRVSTWKR